MKNFFFTKEAKHTERAKQDSQIGNGVNYNNQQTMYKYF